MLLAVIVLVLALVAPLMPQQGVQAAVIEVQNTNNSGPGSLRQAIMNAADGDTIRFADTVRGEIALQIWLTISKNLTIEGPGAAELAISGGDFGRMIEVENATVSIKGLTFTRHDVFGGGILNDGGDLTITRSVITGSNLGDQGAGVHNRGTMTIINSSITENRAIAHGGGIYNSGEMTIVNSTISDNWSEFRGGGIANVGGDLTIINSTISGNETPVELGGSNFGGGIVNDDGTLTIINSTISGNKSVYGGGIANLYGDGTFTITSSTIAHNTSQTPGSGIYTNENAAASSLFATVIDNDGQPNCAEYFPASGYNLATDSSCFGLGGTSAFGFEPILDDLADNGGPTLTHAPLPDSPAIDFVPVDACTVELDQRGALRPQGESCDAGAYEAGDQFLPAPTLTLPELQPVEATGLDGAVVTFAVSAVDWNHDPLEVRCDYQSGETFQIGETEVECSAADMFDRTASGTFIVTVLGPDAPFAALIEDVEHGEIPAFLKPRLLVFLQVAELALERDQTNAACYNLQAFSQQVMALSPRYIASGTVGQLSDEAVQLRAYLGC